jgi:hypothetical protein
MEIKFSFDTPHWYHTELNEGWVVVLVSWPSFGIAAHPAKKNIMVGRLRHTPVPERSYIIRVD